MFRTLMIGAVSALTLSAASFAQQGGTPQEARAMLDKAVAAITDTAKTGQIGDGKIFVFDLQSAVRIRTGETDAAAI